MLSRGHENFTVRFHGLLSDSMPDASFIASPVSASSVLALASVGARGELLLLVVVVLLLLLLLLFFVWITFFCFEKY